MYYRCASAWIIIYTDRSRTWDALSLLSLTVFTKRQVARTEREKTSYEQIKQTSCLVPPSSPHFCYKFTCKHQQMRERLSAIQSVLHRSQAKQQLRAAQPLWLSRFRKFQMFYLTWLATLSTMKATPHGTSAGGPTPEWKQAHPVLAFNLMAYPNHQYQAGWHTTQFRLPRSNQERNAFDSKVLLATTE